MQALAVDMMGRQGSGEHEAGDTHGHDELRSFDGRVLKHRKAADCG